MVKLKMLVKTLLYLLGSLFVIPMTHWHIKMDDGRYAPYTLFQKEKREGFKKKKEGKERERERRKTQNSQE